MKISPRVADRISQDFDTRDKAWVLDRLFSLDIGSSQVGLNERVCAAIVLVADGDVDRFVNAAALAERDWRDVLVSAGLAGEDWRARLDDALRPPPVASTRKDAP